MTAKAQTTSPRLAKMNKLERAYAEYLELLRRAGSILRYDYEPERLRLADDTTFCPDFRIILPDGTVEFHEVKGFMREDAAVKLKVAAEQHPYIFQLVTKAKGGGWNITRIGV